VRPHSVPLKQVAGRIRQLVDDPEFKDNIATGSVDEGEDEAQEGRILYRQHRIKERNQSLVKKKNFKDKHGRLFCVACDFNFPNKYGEVGEGVIDCHHKTPILELEPGQKMRFSDLVLVCPNCHRILHKESMSIEGLQSIIQ